ncbi:hypothetical protein [Tabrizicola sp. TH137]|uniref:hypothetical protein n=1 Tax=Tabrizicola sp. TH137 TaxID=2067452 RepID=UPI00117F866A|nr:hypothetical protein [Tabrizicola sp. TH137]
MASGFFKVDRDIWVDPRFEEEKYTQREAWMWLTSEAAYKPREKVMHNVRYHLERGQLVASVRFLAKAWKWHPTTVFRFLDDQVEANAITISTETGISVITICNFDIFSSKDGSGETAEEHRRNTDETNYKKERNKEESEETACLPKTNSAKQARLDGAVEDQAGDALRRYREQLLEALKSFGSEKADRAVAHLNREEGIAIAVSWRSELGLSSDEVISVVRSVASKAKAGTVIGSLYYFADAMRRYAAKATKLRRVASTDNLPKTSSKPASSKRTHSTAEKQPKRRSKGDRYSKGAATQEIIDATVGNLSTNGSRRKESADLPVTDDLSTTASPKIVSRLELLPRDHPEWKLLEAARSQNKLVQEARADQQRRVGRHEPEG